MNGLSERMKWTREQLEAIREKGGSILVSAAAGSGKTAVLVERIIERISDETDPLDIDRLLVATFTNAAAAEMRERIREALERKLETGAHSEHLRRQLAYIHRSYIMTLHSFCLEVIRTHYREAGLSPGFRIALEAETELLRREVLERLFEQFYASKDADSPFWQLVGQYGTDRSDEPLYRLVERLHDFARSHPWPEHWLDEQAALFQSEQGTDYYFRVLLRDSLPTLAAIRRLLGEALDGSLQPHGPREYAEQLQREAGMVQQVIAAAEQDDWDAFYAAMRAASFDRLKTAKGGDADPFLRERIKALREEAKKRFAELFEECCGRTPEQHREDFAAVAPLMRELVQLVKHFGEQYAAAKRERGLLDFSDLEHFCLRVLRHPSARPGQDIPSDAARLYREQFVEVLIDEYQDTNAVQEAILGLITRTEPGNLFMVGDVKQSIYRFRLAEPGLFLDKFRRFSLPQDPGKRIDLVRNFRSRRQIVDAVNDLFRQIMDETVGEMAYDQAAELVYGNLDYAEANRPQPFDHAVHFVLLDKTADAQEEPPEEPGMREDDAEAPRVEARYIAEQIRRLVGGREMPFLVTDKKTKELRPAQYRDIVILLRSIQHDAPVMLEELRLANIPVYAELSTGYFAAVEVQLMLCLLHIVDNPYQDIPLAAVLRSPLFRFSDEELAQIRAAHKRGPFYDALLHAHTARFPGEKTGEKLRLFFRRLHSWREQARTLAVSELIALIYRETNYLEVAGAMPGGEQREANLRALYDRARQYEKTSFRGLFQFLRFIERFQESGGDLGSVAAIGERENVVRIMSIHKSKGLEFPVVFVAGLGKRFNFQDLNGSFLMHKALGFGPKRVNEELSASYPTLPHIAIRRRLHLEMLAEEMRVLYVALTRAREKLFLLGSVKDAAAYVAKYAAVPSWEPPVLHEGWLASANSCLDWLVPALMRHPDGRPLRELAQCEDTARPVSERLAFPSRWQVQVYHAEAWSAATKAAGEPPRAKQLAGLRLAEPFSASFTELAIRIDHALDWRYPFQAAVGTVSKTSVSELKRRWFIADAGRDQADEETAGWNEWPAFSQNALSRSFLRRPKFLEEHRLSPTERGTLYHTVMQHLPADCEGDAETVRRYIADLAAEGKLPDWAVREIDAAQIAAFFAGELGQRMKRAKNVRKELPFHFGMPASRIDPGFGPAGENEIVLIQGVVDALWMESDGAVLIDYKTDRVLHPGMIAAIKDRYRFQIDMYCTAVSAIWDMPVKEAFLYLFDGNHAVRMNVPARE